MVSKQFTYFIGIDVSKLWLDIAVLNSDKEVILKSKIDNTPEAVTVFIKQLKEQQIAKAEALFCMEYTGKYNQWFLSVAAEQDLSIWVESAVQIKKSQGITRGKSDAVDARRIAEYAYRFADKMQLWTPKNHVIEKLKQLYSKRHQLVKVHKQLMVSCDSNPGDTIYGPPMSELKKAIEKTDRQIRKLIDKDEELKRQYKLLNTVPGIGPMMASYLIIRTEGFTRLTDPKKMACYAGIAPFKYQSGTSLNGKGKISRFGDMHMKSMLMLSVLNTVRSVKSFKTYYERKQAEGKAKMSVINAMKNKLLKVAFVVVKNNQPFDHNYYLKNLELP